QRWLTLGGITFQPSETAKILLILFLAQFIMKYKEKLNTVKILGALVLLFSIPWFLVFKQPDLSTSIVLLVIFCIIVFIGGIDYKLVLTLICTVLPAIAIVIFLAMQPNINILKDYQKDRIMAFINPEEYANDEAYQQLNSITAIGSGRLNGKGYKNDDISSVKNGNFISEAQTDFIFAVIGEEFGFKGTLTVIILLFLIALECIAVARRAKDPAGAMIAGSIGGLIAFQSFFNIGVATFILPNTGLPLPFVSYGLTSLLSLYIAVGLVLNVRLQAIKLREIGIDERR
nr:FtsW/RodA/SpoVE family cell cycle protein [Lachnospiraceae bacterium]